MEDIISVIVITYNQEDTIGRTLDSILMQKCHLPIEIEISDDCSEDGTDSICRQYADKYPEMIRYRHNERNKGIVDNYFDTLLMCRGKYIADCAGDDFWIDDCKLEKEVCILEKDITISLVHTAWNKYNEKSKKTISTEQSYFNETVTDGKNMLEKIITDKFIVHLCTALYRKDIFLKAYNNDISLFRNHNFTCEDLQLCFIMAYYGNIAYIPDVTLNYSINDNSVTNIKNERKQFDFILGITELSYYLSNRYNIHSNKMNKYFRNRFFALIMHVFRTHDYSLCRILNERIKKMNIRKDLRYNLANLIISNNISWSIMLKIRSLFVSVKHFL